MIAEIKIVFFTTTIYIKSKENPSPVSKDGN